MRVALVPYPGMLELVGGHVTQIVETTRALREAGVDAEIVDAADVLGDRADVVHVFGDVRPLLARGRPAARLVATPVYFPRRYVFSPAVTYRSGLARHRGKSWLRHCAETFVRTEARRLRLRDFADQLSAWGRVDLVVANSNAERELLLYDAPGLGDVRVAYSGVAREAFDGDASEGRRLLGLGDEPFVLCVARLEPRKNQVSLAHAVRQLGVRLVLVGTVLPGNERHLDEVRSILPNVVHVSHIDHELLRHVHAAAAAHALPSWYETTGLSTLEALAAGHPVVVSGGPCVEEYFADCAVFCDPGSIRSIRHAVEVALAGPRGTERDYARSFGWDRTARELLDAYGGILHAV